MKKVLIVIPTLYQGGGQKFVMDLANGIDKNKFRVRVLVYFKKSNSVFDKFAEENNIETVYLNKKLGFELSFFKDVKKAVKEFNPDIIHTHLSSMLYLLPSFNRKQVKLHTVHTMADKENFGIQKIVNFIAFKILGVVPVGISDTVAESIAKVHKIKKEKIPVVYNGVDCKRYDIPKIDSNIVNVISVGTIYGVKNYSFLIDCFADILKVTKNTHLTIVGDGVLRLSIEEQIKEIGIENYVTLAGVVGDVENYLAKADIYALSSVFEGLPLSVLEAMSAGLPIVSTDVGGVRDIVENGVNGTLVEFGNKEQYVNALKELILDGDKRSNYSKKSKEFSKKYDEKLTVKGYEELYNK